MLSRLSVLALLTISASTALAQDKQPISNMTCDELLAFYDKLPFTDVLPLDAGPITLDGQERPITIGFSQTGFNHPWRVSMLQAIRGRSLPASERLADRPRRQCRRRQAKQRRSRSARHAASMGS